MIATFATPRNALQCRTGPIHLRAVQPSIAVLPSYPGRRSERRLPLAREGDIQPLWHLLSPHCGFARIKRPRVCSSCDAPRRP